MKSRIELAMGIISVATAWSMKAMADGVVTIDEAVDLAKGIAEQFDFELEIKLPMNTEETPEDPA